MSEIDWSKAPDGATHYNSNIGLFYKVEDGEILQEGYSDWIVSTHDAYRFVEYPEVIQRPAKQEWNGGLPEVGEKVEVWINGVDYWATVTVLAVDVDTVVWRNGTDRASYIGTHIDNVRPLKSQHERQRDELMGIVACGFLGDDGKEANRIVDTIMSRYRLDPKQ